jgi:hypothetical protein
MAIYINGFCSCLKLQNLILLGYLLSCQMKSGQVRKIKSQLKFVLTDERGDYRTINSYIIYVLAY